MDDLFMHDSRDASEACGLNGDIAASRRDVLDRLQGAALAFVGAARAAMPNADMVPPAWAVVRPFGSYLLGADLPSSDLDLYHCPSGVFSLPSGCCLPLSVVETTQLCVRRLSFARCAKA
jgi:hypothetical protein